MKSFSILLMGLLISFSMSSCSSDDDDNGQNGGNGNPPVVVEGNWKVSLFQEDNENQTAHFNGFTFNFEEDGSIYAVNDIMTKNGIWNDGGDDSGNKFNIIFPDTDGPFEEITEDWDILNQTATKLELKHVSGGDGDIDLLTFEKL